MRSRCFVYIVSLIAILLAVSCVYRNGPSRHPTIRQSRAKSAHAPIAPTPTPEPLPAIEKSLPAPVQKPKRKKRGFLQKRSPGTKIKQTKKILAERKERIKKVSQHIRPSGYQDLQRHFKKITEYLHRPGRIEAPQKAPEPVVVYVPEKIKAVFNAHRGLPHQYRATPFWSEPRDATAWLTSLDVSISGNTTKESRDADKKTTELLNMYGPQDLVFLGVDVPNCNPGIGFCAGLKLLELGAIPQLNSLDENFGKLKFNGSFKTIEANISFIQNIGCKGFFVQIHFPIRKLEIKDINPPESLTPASEATLHNLQVVIDTLDLILGEFGLAKNDSRKTGIGDTSLLAGWAYNSCSIDISARAGLLVPTGREKDQREAFSLPFGYNGHFGGQISTEITFKPSDWLTLGAHGHVLLFGDRTKEVRVKTNENQNGFIKLALAEVKVEKGALFNVGAHIKLNPFTRNLALLVSYSYAQKKKDKLTPLDTTTFSVDIINSDIMLQGWHMHTLHFALDYRLGNENSFVRPHLTAFFDYHLTGRHVFKTHNAGGTFGLDLVWYF